MERNKGVFEQAWLFLWHWICQSRVYHWIVGLYGFLRKSFLHSFAVTKLCAESVWQKWLSHSLVMKVLCAPLNFLRWLKNTFGQKLSQGVSQSMAGHGARCLLHHLLALNLPFMGTVVMGVGVGTVFMQTLHPVLSFALIAVGALLFLLRGNLTDWLKSSYLVQGVCALLGIAPDFCWYDPHAVGKRGALLGGFSLGLVFGLLSLFVSPWLCLLAPFGVGFLLLLFARPLVGVFALVFLAPILPTMADVGLCLLCWAAVLYGYLTGKKVRLFMAGVSLLVLLFLGVYLVAALTSFAMVKSLTIWAVYAAFISVFFLIPALVHEKKQLKHLFVVFALSGTAVCLYGICQYVFGWNVSQAWMDEEMFTDIKMRIYSTLENPNVLGEYILLVLPLTIGMMWTAKKWYQKLTYGAMVAVMGVALILTFSRGCWVGLMAAAAVFITFVCAKLWGLALLALPLLPMVLPESIINRFTSIGDMKDSSTSYRVYIWMGTLAMMRDFWICGVGLGAEAFGAVYPFYSYNGIVAPHAHNLFLQIMVESGICGIVLFVLAVLFFLKKMAVCAKWSKNTPLRVLTVALCAGLVGFLVQGMFDNCFYNYRVMLMFWAVLGMGISCYLVAKKEAAA